jgi:hypothetical protein
MAQSNSPGVIYLEVDEDITSAIDKLTKDPAQSVQLVAAKRSTLMQSVINLRLLKKAAADAKKQLVVVTSDRVVTNLAGRIGVPVASQVGEAARVPTAAAASALTEDEIDGGTIGDDDEGPAATAKKVIPVTAAADTVEPEPEPEPEPVAVPQRPAPPSASRPAAVKPTKSKSAVPNIGSMQKKVLWIGGAILLILLLFAANLYLTTAKVTLFMKGTQSTVSFSLTADPTLKQSAIDNGVLAASQLTISKTLQSNVQATGTKDIGTKASGSMTVYNGYDSSPHQLVAGTRFASPDGKIFRSTGDATVPGGTLGGGKIVPGQTTVQVEADQNGDQYNLGPARYSIPGLPADQQSTIYGQGAQMKGGTSKTVKVVTQADVDKAKQSALDSNKDKVQGDLQDKAGKGQRLLSESLQQNVTAVDANPEVGAEGSSGQVSVHVTYTQLAVSESELSQLTRAAELKQVGADKEIYSDGSDKLQLTTLGKPDGDGTQKFTATALAFAGGKVDKDGLAKQMKGKKYGEASDLASQQPDVERVEIKLTPGWATSMPMFAGHIHTEVKVSNQ